MDDENSANHNRWYMNSLSSVIKRRIELNIASGVVDTDYYIAQWFGPNILPKRTELANSEELISIVNANGAVVAKIVKENLQPGFHRVEWHSGIVPNGRYIVTVEQNGKTNAKNVILK